MGWWQPEHRQLVDADHITGEAVPFVAEQVRDDAGEPLGRARFVDLERLRVDRDIALTKLDGVRLEE
jgi:hypothetical protein